MKPCHTQGCWDTPSFKLVGWPSVPALPPHPSFPGVALAGQLSPAVGFGVLWDATELTHTVPVQTDPSPWKRLSLETGRRGHCWERGVSLGKCFPLSITSPGCCLLRNTRNWQAVGGIPGFYFFSVLLWPPSTWQGWQERGSEQQGGIPCTWHRDWHFWWLLKP